MAIAFRRSSLTLLFHKHPVGKRNLLLVKQTLLQRFGNIIANDLPVLGPQCTRVVCQCLGYEDICQSATLTSSCSVQSLVSMTACGKTTSDGRVGQKKEEEIQDKWHGCDWGRGEGRERERERGGGGGGLCSHWLRVDRHILDDAMTVQISRSSPK